MVMLESAFGGEVSGEQCVLLENGEHVKICDILNYKLMDAARQKVSYSYEIFLIAFSVNSPIIIIIHFIFGYDYLTYRVRKYLSNVSFKYILSYIDVHRKC